MEPFCLACYTLVVVVHMFMYSRRHKKVPIPYSYYDCKTLSPVKRYYPIMGANHNYGSSIYSVIARFIRVNNARA